MWAITSPHLKGISGKGEFVQDEILKKGHIGQTYTMEKGDRKLVWTPVQIIFSCPVCGAIRRVNRTLVSGQSSDTVTKHIHPSKCKNPICQSFQAEDKPFEESNPQWFKDNFDSWAKLIGVRESKHPILQKLKWEDGRGEWFVKDLSLSPAEYVKLADDSDIRWSSTKREKHAITERK